MEKLKNFRAAIYSHFYKRRDAIMNLLDAISSYGHQSRSIVGLSEAPCFERQYSSITDAIADGLTAANWAALETEQFNMLFNRQGHTLPCFLTDCTPNPRLFSNSLKDRTITHSPNPAPGNKPICVGHQYSLVAMLPDDSLAHDKKWIAPLSFKRVGSHEKGNEVGMTQIMEQIKHYDLEENLAVSVGDSLYGTESCRVMASQNDNLIHLFRVNSKRNLFSMPNLDESKSRGRKKEYGVKMVLSKPETHPGPCKKAETGYLARSGKIYTIKICAWENMLMRGSKKHKASKHPMTLVQIHMSNDEGVSLFKRPLWVVAFGKQRSAISLVSIYQYYASRYNIEHFFRFGKNNLLLDAYQTPDVEHDEQWWKLCGLAYNQLYLAKSLVSMQVKPWEKYLPEFKQSTFKGVKIATASQTQRGFAALLEQIGTPALPCVARGRAGGRQPGQSGILRPAQPIIFKTPKAEKVINSDLESNAELSEPEKINALMKLVCSTLAKLEYSKLKFSQMLCDSS